MAQAVLEVSSLPSSAVESAQSFHADHLPRAAELLSGDADSLVIVLQVAEYDHADWRRAVARDLARAHKPKRVNLVGGDDPAAISAALRYLDGAPGVTGHYLALNSTGAGDPLRQSG